MNQKNQTAPVQALRIVQNKPSEDTIDSLTWMLTEAVAGRLIGLAYVALFKERKFLFETTGEAYQNPLYALGAVQVLADDMKAKIRVEP